MTTFTTEDRIQLETPTWEEKWGKDWVNAIRKDWNNQTSIQYFWPLTEQISLDLNYSACDTRPSKGLVITSGTGITYNSAWGVTNIAPQLTVSPNNPTGYIKIGGVNIGMEKKPNLFQRVIHKLLGFDWKDK